jgi:hypothetical protein
MASTIDIYPGGIERFGCPTKTDIDVGDAVPQFAVTATTETPEESDFIDGAWLDEPVQSGNVWKGRAATPRIGDTGSDIVLTEGSWSTWLRIEKGGEVLIEKLVTRLRMRA